MPVHPAWIIVFFVVATLVVLAYGALSVLRALRQLEDHVDVLSSAPIIADLDTIAMRAQRLGALSDRVNALRARLDAAKAQLSAAALDLKMRPATDALGDAREDVRELVAELT